MCEDAELGLRLMRSQLRTVYVDQVMGEGLTPDSFADFKKQRTRWAQGGMQILKANWRALLIPAATGTPTAERLSLSQRYHFLAGWLPWFGDALHLVFVLASLAWTFAVLAIPASFAFPLALYMMPLAAFCLAKLVMGPLLYWRRVACSWKGIVGAAVAGMGLSHAIARGVVAGLWGRSHVFHVTGKGNGNLQAYADERADGQAQGQAQGQPQGDKLAIPVKPKRWRLAASSVREEAMLFFGLLLAIAAVAITRESGERESLFWMGMLVLQSMPYLAAMLSAWAAALSATGSVPVAQAQADKPLPTRLRA